MSRIFISHSSRDNFAAIALRDWLAAEGWREVFLDLDPDRGIVAGERWERALHEAATRCEAVVFLVSAQWLASPWCDTEYALARGLNKKLLAVLIDPALTIAALPQKYTGTWQMVDLTAGQDLQIFRVQPEGSHEERHVRFSGAGLTRLKRGLEKAGLDPKFFAWPPPGEPARAPYRGLKPLEAEDSGIFSAATRRSSRRPTSCAASPPAPRRASSCFSARPARANPRSCAPACYHASPATTRIFCRWRRSARSAPRSPATTVF